MDSWRCEFVVTAEGSIVLRAWLMIVFFVRGIANIATGVFPNQAFRLTIIDLNLEDGLLLVGAS